jgi:HAMP domain-containing protein
MNGARKKTISLPLRGTLVFSVLLLVLVSAGLPLYMSWVSARRGGMEASVRIADEIAERVVSHIEEFLHIPYIVNRLNSYVLGEGILSVDDEGALEHLFRRQVDILQPLTSIYFGNNRGGLVDSGREAPYDSRYVITTEGGAAGTFRKYAIDKDGRRGKLLAEVPDFDGRTRDWYMRALTSGGAAWSDVYVLFTGQDMVVTASRPVFDRSGSILGVVAVDISMLQLSGFLQTLHLGDEVVFVLDGSGLLTASSTGEKTVVLTEEGKLRRIAASESASPEIRAAAAFVTAREPSGHSACSGRVLIDPDGRYFHVRAVPVRGPGDLDWTVVVAAPESALSAGCQAGDDWRFLLALSAGLLFSLATGLFLARWIAGPILRLRDAAGLVARGGLLADLPYGYRITEMDELSSSFTTIAERLNDAVQELSEEVVARREAGRVARAASDRAEELSKEAERAGAARRRFMEAFNSEIRPAIDGLTANLELLKDAELNPEQRARLENAAGSAASLREIVARLPGELDG